MQSCLITAQTLFYIHIIEIVLAESNILKQSITRETRNNLNLYII